MSEFTDQGYGDRQDNYKPMPLANPIPKETFGDDGPAPHDPYTPLSPEQAADVLNEQRLRPQDQQTDVPPVEEPAIKRRYMQIGGEHHGEDIDPRSTVSAEQAAHDLTLAREADAQAIKAAEDAQLQQVIDQLRGADQQQPVSAEPTTTPETPAQAEQPQTEQTPEHRVAEALKDPAVLAALQTEISRYEQAAQQAILQNANVTLANISARYPELRNVGLDQWPTVLNTLAQSAPQRFQQITSELQGTRANLEQAYQVMAHQQQEYQNRVQQGAAQAVKNFNAAAKEWDADFDQWRRAEGISDGALEDLRKESRAMLREVYTDEQIAEAWHAGPLRNAGVQRIICDAARYRASKRGLAKAAAKPVRPVQHPSSPTLRASARDYSNRELEAKLNYSGSARDAAALLNARRSGRR